jgi:hypothetical protein
MPDEKKKRVVIASVLKPVDDTRMSEKIGKTLADLNGVEVSVIGSPSSSKVSGLKSLELNEFSRLSFKRISATWRVLRHVLRINPDVFIVTTHELIFVALIARMFTQSKLIYDIQENYYRNIKFTRTFPAGIRDVLAFYVRAKELLSSPFFHHYFLAERSYEVELNFVGRKFTVLENKAIRPKSIRTERSDPFALLFSGTIAETTGVFVAVKLADKLHEVDPRFTLTIIGFCAQKSELIRLWQELASRPFINLIGGEKLIPHDQIIEWIKKAGAGIIAYPQNPSTTGSIPTKLYEYIGYHLPILITRHPQWEDICQPFNAAYSFDPERLAPREIVQFLQNQQVYPKNLDTVYWDSEAPKLLAIIGSML